MSRIWTRENTMKLASIFLVSLAFSSLGAIQKADAQNETAQTWYSESNAPIFYGCTSISIDKDVLTSFDVKDSRFRIFARDYEDGDLTPSITSTVPEIDTTKAGAYSIKYSVTDSHKNTSTLDVPLTINDATGGKVEVIRSVYALPKMENMSATGMTRCNTGDSQILGIYMPADSSVSIKLLDTGLNQKTTIWNWTDTRNQNSSSQIPADGSVLTLKNVRNSVSYDTVPLLTSPTLSEEKIDQVYRYQLNYDSSVKPLDYYHYKDDEETFKKNWEASGNTYGIISGEAITFVVPKGDIRKLSTNDVQGSSYIGTLDESLEYFLEVVDRMDRWTGLSFNPPKWSDRNYRTKYTFALDKNYGGGSIGAFYGGNWVGLTQPSISAIFQYGWGTIHEIGHGYQGYFGRGIGKGESLYLNETGNNILAYYIQTDKTLYKNSGLWIDINAGDSEWNKARLTGNKIFNNAGGTYTNTHEKLYCLVNLLSAFEGGETYGKLFSYYRDIYLNKGDIYTIPDIYSLFFLEEYGADVTSYLESWTMEVSPSIRRKIAKEATSTYLIAGDTLSSDSSFFESNRKYGIYKESDLSSYASQTSILKINVSIDDETLFGRKKVVVKKGGETYKSIPLTKETTLTELSIGSYELVFPFIDGYIGDETPTINVAAGENEYTYTYTKADYSYKHYEKLVIKGRYYNTAGFTFALSQDNTHGDITLGGSNLGNQNDTWKNKPDEVYMAVYLYDQYEEMKASWVVTGNKYFSDLSKDYNSLTLEYGDIIKVTVPSDYPLSKIGVYSIDAVDDASIEGYAPTSASFGYKITEKGFLPTWNEDLDIDGALYSKLSPSWKKKMDSLVEGFDDEIYENKAYSSEEKNEFLAILSRLSDSDKEAYAEVKAKILQGGIPTVTAVKENPTLDLVGYSKDLLYSLIKVVDNEDGEMILDDSNTTISIDKGDITDEGEYQLTYAVKDSDNNEVTYKLSLKVIDSNNSKGKAMWGIAGVVIAVLGVIGAIVVFILFRRSA